MHESKEREEQIFEAALAFPEGERPRYLDGACGGDAELRGRVENLLHAHDSAGKFMDSPAAPDAHDDSPPPAASPAAAEASGTRIGRYKLLQKIGEGGCGAVWMAEQEEPVRRHVALKIVKLGMDTREVIARFDAERQALAMLDHTNIAKILDAGSTETGRPYFVMELVRGIKITEFCDRNNLSMNQRLELFSQVCHAVQHAHQKGIIHRDLKPSNVLVTINDGVPVPKVIDFGIAKATAGRLTDHTLFTAFEQFIGTPSYMSPEQAELSGIDVDTRSDIYSLGVLLYELLTGRLPFDPKTLLRAGIDEIRRIIREVEPPRPSTNLSTLGNSDRAQVARFRNTDPVKLSLLLRGDLDWIVMRCLEKNRTRRYDTPNALAADIARHLNSEPVVARPPSRFYRFSRLVRRNRLAFVTIVSVSLALLAGLVVSTWQAVRARRAERLADLERSEAVAERTRAEDLLKFMLGDLYTQLNKVGRLDVLEAVADKATAYFESLNPADLSETTQLSRARALRLLGGVRVSQARYVDALNALEEAYPRAVDLAVRHPTNEEMLHERAEIEFGLGEVHLRRADNSGAREWLTRYRETCAALVALDPASSARRAELGDGQYNLAVLMKDRREFADARSAFLQYLASAEQLISADQGNFDFHDMIEDAHLNLGEIAELQGDYREALLQYSAQSKQLEYLTAADPKTATWRERQSVAFLNVMTVDMVTGQYAAAYDSLLKAQKLLAALVALDGTNYLWRHLSLNASLAEASLSRQQGDIGKALRIVEGIMTQLEDVSSTEPSDREFATLLLDAWTVEAHFKSLAGRADAADSATRAVEIAKKLSRSNGASDAEIGECAYALLVAGEIASKSGDLGEARLDWMGADALLNPRVQGCLDWRILDPSARTAAMLCRFSEARATIEKLNHLGYVPIEPWPQLD